ncbi:MAG: amino acid permease [Candidatus Melainabacteria bacterium]|nr:amino acid permease [Candidatus Melainabacteria bacterium]MBI3307752.1 amino acid permease [Candidatus Melainabacteria bacterium]
MPKNNLLRVKDIETVTNNGAVHGHSLVRTLGTWDLISLGIGCIIGTGIFVLTGIAAANYAGPGVFISFLLAGFACALAAFVYSEFASLVPLSGSAYTYVYVTLGEVAAWLIGWTLLLEYLVSVSVVAIGWSAYFNNFISHFGLEFPKVLAASPGTHDVPGAIMDLPAAAIIIFLTFLSIAGIKNSSKFNNIIVAIKVTVVLFFIIFGLFHINPEYWHPFIPERVATSSGHAIDVLHLPFSELLLKLHQGTLNIHNDLVYHYGWQGIVTAAGIVFFAYIGFDAVSTVAEETKNPQIDLPIGILGSLVICTFLYLCVSLVLTGLIPVSIDGHPNPALTGHNAGAALSIAFTELGYKWAALIVSFGALCGMTSIILVMIVAQARILFAMARDGLLPKIFSWIHPKYRTPVAASLTTGIFSAIIAAFTPILTVAELTSIGTLAAFTFVSMAVLILRGTKPELKAKFRCPFMPYTAILGIIINLLLMFGLPTATWVRFVGWMLIGFFVYYTYGFWCSKLREK